MLPGVTSVMMMDSSATGGGGGVGGSFAVSVSPTYLSKSGSTRGSNKALTTAPATVIATGGAGGYSYSWARVSGDAAITATAPAAASSAFSATLTPDEEKVAVFACTVTDASGAHVTTEHVTVNLNLIFIDIGGTL